MDERLQRLARQVRQVRRFALPTKDDEGFDEPGDDELSPEEFAEEERKRAKIKKIIWARFVPWCLQLHRASLPFPI